MFHAAAFILSLLTILSFPAKIHAVCPVCTVAIGIGVGISRYLGIDDTVSGVWTGGLLMSASFWLSNWFKGKKIKIPYPTAFSILFIYLISVFPLKLLGITGHVLNTIWGVDKLIMGIITGSALFLISVLSDRLLRLQNGGKVYIYYQKVIIPVTMLTLASLAFYIITK